MIKKFSQHGNDDSGSKSRFPIMNMLPVGRENAIPTADLVRMTGCTSSRDLQERIASERNAGAIICSGSGKGYWRAKNRQLLSTDCHDGKEARVGIERIE